MNLSHPWYRRKETFMVVAASTDAVARGGYWRARSIRCKSLLAVALIAALLVVVPTTGASAQTVVGSALTSDAPVNLLSFTDDPAVPFSSPGDGFGVYQRGVSAGIPLRSPMTPSQSSLPIRRASSTRPTKRPSSESSTQSTTTRPTRSKLRGCLMSPATRISP